MNITKNGKICEDKLSFGSGVGSAIFCISSNSSTKTLLFLGGGAHLLFTQLSDIF